MYIIPVTSDPNQTFKCAIPVDGKAINLIFHLHYNLQAEYWTMTINDAKTNEILVDSIPLLAGEYPAANLMEQYSHLGIGSAAIVKVDPDILEDNPTGDTLGTGFKLVWSNTI